jgi:hypothetical protein
MKSSHVINIGYPKSGTTWLWAVLEQQEWFSCPREKENTDLTLGITTVDQYIKDYANYNITANFDTSLFAVDQYIIRLLSEIDTTTISIILRNPFELYWSLYNFLNKKHINSSTFSEYIVILHSQGWMNRTNLILERWIKFFPPERFKIFFYEDLKSNSELFFLNYCSQMNLPIPTILDLQKINVTTYHHRDDQIADDIVATINYDIDQLQILIDRDISHWKR